MENSADREELQRHRVNAAATVGAFMNYTSADRSRMVSHIIPVSGVRRDFPFREKFYRGKPRLKLAPRQKIGEINEETIP